jgi:hypothetical protein
MEDAQEARAQALLAQALGLTPEEAEIVGATAEEDQGQSGDGLTYGYSVSFARDADPAIMAKVRGLEADGLVHLGPNDLDDDEGPDGPDEDER